MSRPLYQEDLAYIHHAGFRALAEQAAPWIVSQLRRRGLVGGRVVELGCGGGVVLRALAEAGYEPYGIDASAEMLALARTIAPGVALEQASLYECAIPPCVAVVAVGEGLNYWAHPSPPPTAALFGRVATALDPNGFLLFDVITRRREVPAPYRTWAAGPDWACLVEVKATASELVREITTFRLHEGSYRRAAETHRVHLFPESVLRRELVEAGFAPSTRRAYGATPLAPGRRLFWSPRQRSGTGASPGRSRAGKG